MEKYSFTFINKNHISKGKMYEDCDQTLKKNGFHVFEFVNGCFIKKIYLYFKALFISISFKRKSVFFIQYPHKFMLSLFYFTKFIFVIKNIKTILFIHDIEALRWEAGNKKLILKEIGIIRKFDYVICHNQKMKSWLVSYGLDEKRIFSLNLFDYLIDDKIIWKKRIGNQIAIASNLSVKKSKYVYKLPIFQDVVFNLYGPNYETCVKQANVHYFGSMVEKELIQKINGKFGLVWDGDSIETCSGNIGHYLQYNNPFKVSMYIAAGLPVIVWDKSALADFVNENNIGITVNNLLSLDFHLKKINEKDYAVMTENVRKLQKKVISGYFLSFVLKEVLKNIEDNI